MVVLGRYAMSLCVVIASIQSADAASLSTASYWNETKTARTCDCCVVIAGASFCIAGTGFRFARPDRHVVKSGGDNSLHL